MISYLTIGGTPAPNSGWPRWYHGLPVWYWYYSIYPIIYLAFCIFSCTKLLRGVSLVVAGLGIHMALFYWVIIWGESFSISRRSYFRRNVHCLVDCLVCVFN